MLKATVEEKAGNKTSVKLEGTIDETVDFAKVLGAPTEIFRVNCKGLNRINSVGVKAWIQYFSSMKKNNPKSQLIFAECSPTIVEQINMISNFTCGGVVESLCLPYHCTNAQCGTNLIAVSKLEDLKKLNGNVPGSVKCPKCGNPAEFDDLPEEYLAFLERSS